MMTMIIVIIMPIISCSAERPSQSANSKLDNNKNLDMVILLIRAIIISSTSWLSSQPLRQHVSHITTAYNVGEDRLKIGCREEAFNKRTNMVIVQLTRITRKKGQWGVITCNQRLLVPYSLVTGHVMVACLLSKWSGDQYPSYHTLWPWPKHSICMYVYVTPLSQAQTFPSPSQQEMYKMY